MIKEIKILMDKYNKISKHSEYVNVSEISTDLYRLILHARLMRIPKDER